MFAIQFGIGLATGRGRKIFSDAGPKALCLPQNNHLVDLGDAGINWRHVEPLAQKNVPRVSD
jgi:hypothetical protein